MAATAAAYDAVAGTRPRIRRDVLFTQTPDGVLFHDAQGGFRLRSRTAYRFSTLIVPYLNGENRVADICENLGPQQRAMVAELVRTLFDRGFARDVPEPDGTEKAAEPAVAARFATQIDYIDHYADAAPGRFLAFRDTRVAVLGGDEVARWCALSLVRNGSATVGVTHPDERVVAESRQLRDEGCPVELVPLPGGEPLGWADLAGFDLVVAAGGAAGPRQVFTLLEAGVPEGKAVLPAWTFGERAVVGPLSSSGRAGCWTCAALRLSEHGDAEQATQLWTRVSLPEPAGGGAGGGLRGPLAAMTGNLLGYEVFRIATRALPAETEGRIVVQDTESLDVAAEPLLPHPRCPFCGGAAGGPGEAFAPVEPVTAVMPTAETAREADALVDELNARSSALVRPNAGVFTRFLDEELTQTPLKVSTLELPGAGRRRVSAFDVHHVAGARLRALGAAAVVHAERMGVLAEVRDPDLPRVDAARLALRTGTAAAEPAEYATAVSLLTKEAALVPAAAVYPLGARNQDRLVLPTSAGAGAGGTSAEAVGQGVLSALAHDALLRSLRGAGTGAQAVAPVPLGGLGDDPELVFLVRTARNLSVEADLLDLGEAACSGVSVLLARAADPGTGEPLWAVGADTSWRAAAAAALRDLLGRVQLGRERPGAADLGDPLLTDLDPWALAAPDAAARVPGGRVPAGAAGAAAAWPDVLERLRAAGRDALVVPTAPADLLAGGLHTVRVVLADAR